LLVRGASLFKRIDPLLCQFFVDTIGVLFGGFVENVDAEAVEDAGDSGGFGAEEFCGGRCEGMEGFWSRSVLTHQIESQLYLRDGQSLTNFAATLPTPQSDLAKQILKDPYNFDFLMLREKHDEQELENALVEHITKFLLELGSGFSYLGRQYLLEVGGDKFVMDLLPCASAVLCYGSTFSSVLDSPNASRKMGRISWGRLRNMRSSLGFCLYLIPASSILRARASSG
jgi:predicted nuclease of restriction endonuclease-like (RecB) superfamily